MHTATIVLAMALAAAAQQRGPVPSPPATSTATIERAQVQLIDEVELAAQEAGSLLEILVEEGDHVSEGDPIARIDDALPKSEVEVAKYRLKAAEAEADNEVNVEAATADVALIAQELERMQDANDTVPGATPQIELDRKQLEKYKATLQVKQAEHELIIAKVTVDVRQAELEASDEAVRRREINATLDGVVEELYLRKGEFVRPGDPVARIVRMNRLNVSGRLDAERVSPSQVDGQPVMATVTLPHGRTKVFQGKIVHFSSIIDSRNQFLVKAELINEQDQNGYWLVRPGMTASLTIQVK